MNDRTLFLHYHVPKTGGQTIRHALTEMLDIGTTFVHLATAAERAGITPHSNAGLATLGREQRERIKIIVGHQVDEHTRAIFPDRSLFEFTVLRDPAVRMVSHFNFSQFMAERRGERLLDFDEWYSRRKPNEMTRFLSHHLGVPGGELPDRLAEFDFIGSTETMDRWLPSLFRVMGLPATIPPRVNVTGVDHQQRLRLDDDLRRRVERDHPRDVELFRTASVEWFEPFSHRLRQLADERTNRQDDP